MQWEFVLIYATEYEFSREDQDNYAIQSYERSAKAWEAGKFDQEVVFGTTRKGDPIIISKDEEFSNVKWIAYQL
jgi:acetyl-CoA C-acetyltransferase